MLLSPAATDGLLETMDICAATLLHTSVGSAKSSLWIRMLRKAMLCAYSAMRAAVPGSTYTSA